MADLGAAFGLRIGNVYSVNSAWTSERANPYRYTRAKR